MSVQGVRVTPLEEAVEVFKRGAATMAPDLGPDDDWMPCFAYQTSDGSRFMVEAPWIGSDGRHRLMQGLAVVLYEEDAVAVAYIHVIYVLRNVTRETARKIESGDAPRPSEHPDRVECLSIHGVDRAGVEVSTIAEITRRPDEHPSIGPWEDAPDDVRIVGSMFDPLRWAVKAPRLEEVEL